MERHTFSNRKKKLISRHSNIYVIDMIVIRFLIFIPINKHGSSQIAYTVLFFSLFSHNTTPRLPHPAFNRSNSLSSYQIRVVDSHVVTLGPPPSAPSPFAPARSIIDRVYNSHFQPRWRHPMNWRQFPGQGKFWWRRVMQSPI